MVAKDGEPIAFGDTGAPSRPQLIPGHTPGALGFVFDVKDGDRTHTGSAIRRLDSALCANLGRRPRAVPALDRAVRAASRRLGSTASNVEIQKSTRSDDGFMPKLERRARRTRGEAHPFVVGATA